MYLLPKKSAITCLSHQQKIAFGIVVAASGLVLQATNVTSIAPAVAPTLYAAGLIPALGATNIRQIAISAICLAILSFSAILLGRGYLQPGARASELLASFGTITIMTILLIAAFHLKSRVHALTKALAKEKRRSEALFDLSPVALWEQDYTEVVNLVRKLKDTGVTNVAEYAASNPTFVDTAANLITTRAVNRAALNMLGAETEDELLGCLRKFLPDDVGPFIAVMQALLDEKRCYEGTAKMRGPHGRACTAYIAIRFRSRECAFDRVIVGMMDVTERQQMISDLRDANLQLETARRFSEMGILTSTIAHELSQPVTGVKMNAQTALRWLRGKGDVQAAIRSLELVLRDSQRASDIITLTRSRLSSKQSEPSAPVKLDGLIEDVAHLIQEELVASGVRLDLHLNAGAAEVAGPPVELQQIFVNLISNAAQAVRCVDWTKRRVSVQTQLLPSGKISVKVSDSGAGISETIADRLFAPLVTTKPDGMGMGLSIARSAVERRGGRIWAYNSFESGAVFELSFPAFASTGEQDKVSALL